MTEFTQDIGKKRKSVGPKRFDRYFLGEHIMSKKWFMLDLARKRSFCREEVETLLALLQRSGYNGIGLYLEGFFSFSCYGGAPRQGCMDKNDAKWVVETAEKYNLNVMPLTNLVGHAESFLEQERFTGLAKTQNQFDITNKDFLNFSKSIIDEFIDCFNPSIIHIGGDEVSLSENEKEEYALFLSNMGSYLKEKNIQAGIWSDMLLNDRKICDKISKENIIVFDWWYYGHREESSKILREYGFDNIVVCPGTQTWNGIVATQHKCPWRAELSWDSSIDIHPEEVEAFIEDSAKSGVSDVMLCDWENYFGHTLWNGAHTIARCGCFINEKGVDDLTLSHTIFGKETPYMEAIHLLTEVQHKYIKQCEKLPGRFLTHQRGVDFIFEERAFSKFFLCGEYFSKELADEFYNASEKVENLLDNWDAKTDIEILCKNNLKFACVFARAISASINISNAKREDYKEAALIQFSDAKKYDMLMNSVISDFEKLSDMYVNLIETLETAIYGTGHTADDIKALNDMREKVNTLCQELKKYTSDGEYYTKGIALRSWQCLIADSFVKVDLNA